MRAVVPRTIDSPHLTQDFNKPVGDVVFERNDWIGCRWVELASAAPFALKHLQRCPIVWTSTSSCSGLSTTRRGLPHQLSATAAVAGLTLEYERTLQSSRLQDVSSLRLDIDVGGGRRLIRGVARWSRARDWLACDELN